MRYRDRPQIEATVLKVRGDIAHIGRQSRPEGKKHNVKLVQSIIKMRECSVTLDLGIPP